MCFPRARSKLAGRLKVQTTPQVIPSRMFAVRSLPDDFSLHFILKHHGYCDILGCEDKNPLIFVCSNSDIPVAPVTSGPYFVW